MTVSDIMTTRVISVGMDDTLSEIRRIFKLNHIHHLPVVQENRLVGIISDRDVLRDLCPNADTANADVHALNTLKKKAHQIMTRRVVTISPEDSVEEASAAMLAKKFSCLPVMVGAGEIVGIVTKTDLLTSLLGETSPARI